MIGYSGTGHVGEGSEHVTGGLMTSGVWVESFGSVTGGEYVALFNLDVEVGVPRRWLVACYVRLHRA